METLYEIRRANLQRISERFPDLEPLAHKLNKPSSIIHGWLDLETLNPIEDVAARHIEHTLGELRGSLDHPRLSEQEKEDITRRFTEFPISLSDTLYALGKTAQADAQFASMLEKLEGIGIRIQAQLYDQ